MLEAVRDEPRPRVGVEPSRLPKDVVYGDGTAALYRFRAEPGAADRLPVLLVPSMINRWYVLDLDEGSSVVAAILGAGLDTFVLDWGAVADEDRYLSWDDVVAKVARAVRRTLRNTGHDELALLGYCMGGTLAAIHTALEPDTVCGLVNLAGPIDFSEGGLLRHMVDPRWFDADAIAEAGNVAPVQMQAGFTALRPTLNASKLVRWADRGHDPKARRRMSVLEAWASDNVAFPAAAYTRYIGELYQNNELVNGEHRIAGRRVDLKQIRCPILTIVAERDTICPPPAATALGRLAGSTDTDVLSVSGGHVGAVVGSAAKKHLYPQLCTWLRERCTISN
jgi:polyhydroxyalkanoate synthase